MKKFLHSRNGASKGAALIIVLAFVVLVTALAVTHFSRSTADRQLAQSSYNDTSADLLARMPGGFGETAMCLLVMLSSLGAINGSVIQNRLPPESDDFTLSSPPLGASYARRGRTLGIRAPSGRGRSRPPRSSRTRLRGSCYKSLERK